MQANFEYYYNNVPGKGLCRNNLIYTSLISKDRKVFCQWYHNDTEYHRGQNQVVDPDLMQEKWYRELKYLTLMNDFYPENIPKIIDIHHGQRKIFLEIEDYDFWQQSFENGYNSILPDWQQQMISIFKAHKQLGIYKYSLHPSSYFIVNGKLKSINYFFCYEDSDNLISLRNVMSHISNDRQADLFPKMASMGIDVDQQTPFKDIQMLAFESFKTDFPNDFMDQAKKIYE